MQYLVIRCLYCIMTVIISIVTSMGIPQLIELFMNFEEQLYSLEQYIGCFWRLAFIHYCGLHQVWLEAEN